MIKPITIRPPGPYAFGATQGQELMARIRSELDSAKQLDCALVLELQGIEATNASFLKATVLWAFRCGQADVRRESPTSADPWAIRPLRLFPVVTGCQGEVREEVDEFFRGRHLPILHLPEESGHGLGKPTVLGALDPVLARTFELLEAVPEATAADLASRSEDKITLTGWNNRLADLHLLRLASRRREGKFWVYRAADKGVLEWV